MSKENKKPFYKSFWFYLLCVVLVIIVISIASKSSDETTSNSNSPAITQTSEEKVTEVKTPLVTTVDELLEAYDENELKAEKTYKGQYVELTGRVSTISANGFILNELSNEFSLNSIECNTRNEDILMELKDDQEITVIGTITKVGGIFYQYNVKVESIK